MKTVVKNFAILTASLVMTAGLAHADENSDLKVAQKQADVAKAKARVASAQADSEKVTLAQVTTDREMTLLNAEYNKQQDALARTQQEIAQKQSKLAATEGDMKVLRQKAQDSKESLSRAQLDLKRVETDYNAKMTAWADEKRATEEDLHTQDRLRNEYATKKSKYETDMKVLRAELDSIHDKTKRATSANESSHAALEKTRVELEKAVANFETEKALAEVEQSRLEADRVRNETETLKISDEEKEKNNEAAAFRDQRKQMQRHPAAN